MTLDASILDACHDDELFGRWFGQRGTWDPWFAFLAGLFGLPMSEEQARIYQACTGRTILPTTPALEGWLICGRRAGKSFMLAVIAVYLACFRDYSAYLSPGERATIKVVAADRRQAGVILRYVKGLVAQTPLLAQMIARETDETLDLDNAVTIEVGTASFRSIRGYTLAAALCDELAFWRTDDTSANPDTEILDALRPGMATIPGALLLCASSPYARRGTLWAAFRRFYGVEDPEVLVWKAATRTMNPTVRQGVIDRAMEQDAAKAGAEYGAEFRADLEDYVPRERIEAVVSPDVHERPPISTVSYSAFVDPSGGQQDSMTMAIGHKEGMVAILDAVRERRPPFSPEDVVAEFAALLKSYRIGRVQGDRYAGEWPREAFRKQGIAYEASAKPKSDLYRDLLPRINSGEVDLLDEPRLVAQLCGLERRTSRGGRDSIDHAPGQHDDVANAVAGCLVQVIGRRAYGMLDVA